MDGPVQSDPLERARKRLGRKQQVGGALAAFIGLLLFLAAGQTAPGLVDLHKLALLFIVVGILGLAVGTFARWYYLK